MCRLCEATPEVVRRRNSLLHGVRYPQTISISAPALPTDVGQIMKKVKKPFVQLTHVASAVIAKKLVEAIDCIWNVHISSSINNVDPLVRVGVEEPQPVFPQRTRRGSCGRRLKGNNKEHRRHNHQ